MPTYADLEPQCVAWAAARELLHPDGSPNKSTPMGQHRKTLEEIGEATGALRTLSSFNAWARGNNYPELAEIHGELRRSLALELGDILVTLLTIQSAMHGKTLEQCKAESGRLTTGYGSDWYLGIENQTQSKQPDRCQRLRLSKSG